MDVTAAINILGLVISLSTLGVVGAVHRLISRCERIAKALEQRNRQDGIGS
ncbi:hypothetical protein M0R72_07660 [Candidatus Pacearchaeota archaeon]|jgi:hypothetical protein|nr:hypothetical protein [Candidatus Pacearchaeota archaeon]